MTIMSTSREELQRRKQQINQELVSFRARLNSLTDADGVEIERLAAEKDRIDAELAPKRLGASREEPAEAGDLIRLSDGRRAAVARGQSFRDHPVVSEYAAANTGREQAVIGHHGSFGQMLRAMTTTSGSAVVPTLWASGIIDRARNLAAVTRAGAQIIPMDSKTVNIGRLTGDPTAAFRSEGGTITASDPVFDNVTLDSKTMSCLVVGSLEWFMDAPNIDSVVEDAIASAFA
jgi:HK97 family phage major capsid protein